MEPRWRRDTDRSPEIVEALLDEGTDGVGFRSVHVDEKARGSELTGSTSLLRRGGSSHGQSDLVGIAPSRHCARAHGGQQVLDVVDARMGVEAVTQRAGPASRGR